jgi:hypothetical protein
MSEEHEGLFERIEDRAEDVGSAVDNEYHYAGQAIVHADEAAFMGLADAATFNADPTIGQGAVEYGRESLHDADQAGGYMMDALEGVNPVLEAGHEVGHE